MAELKHPFPAIKRGEVVSWGGNQQWLDSRCMQKSACGVISCTDLLLYLHRHRPGCQTELFEEDDGEGPVPIELYNRWVGALRTRYLPVIPYVGTIGAELAFALNRYFKKYGIPLHASWSVGKQMLWRSMEAMLDNDLPVILAVGPNFPLPIRRHKLSFYRPGQNTPATGTSGHFVTVTGMDEERLRISSWGKVYYIRREEFWNYARRHGNFYTSSILWVWPG